jgi:lambda family phage portal protein
MAIIPWLKSLVFAKTPKNARRNYEGGKSSGPVWGGPTTHASPSADYDLAASRAVLFQRSRHAHQNNASARAIVEGLVALIVSSGIDIVPDTGNEDDDAALREQVLHLIEHADASGRCDLWELQRQAMRSWQICGEFLWQIVDIDDPSRPFPFAIMALEPDQLSDEPIGGIESGNDFSYGIETNRYGKPVFYHVLSCPAESPRSMLGGSLKPNSGGSKSSGAVGGKAVSGARIPADRIIHGFEPLRPGQKRGEPGLAPVLGTLHQEKQLVETELTSAKIGAAPAMAIKTTGSGWPNASDPNFTESNGQGQRQYDFTPGAIAVLGENEEIQVLKNDRPSQMIAPFRLMLRGDLAGAMRIPQRYIDRDVSRANYSSMRADMLDTRRLLDPVQNCFARFAAKRVYDLAFVQLATAAGVQIPREGTPERLRMQRCKIHPDGWAYVDPEKDVKAAVAAITAGLSTWSDEAQRRGGDIDQIWKKLAEDTAKAKAMGLTIDLSGTNAPAPDPTVTAAKPEPEPAKPEAKKPDDAQ